jgi:hypothetical protein
MSKNPTKCRKKDLASSPTGTRKNAVVNRRIRGRQKQNFKDQAFKTWLLQGDVEPTADEKYWKGYFEERSALDKLRSASESAEEEEEENENFEVSAEHTEFIQHVQEAVMTELTNGDSVEKIQLSADEDEQLKMTQMLRDSCYVLKVLEWKEDNHFRLSSVTVSSRIYAPFRPGKSVDLLFHHHHRPLGSHTESSRTLSYRLRNIEQCKPTVPTFQPPLVAHTTATISSSSSSSSASITSSTSSTLSSSSSTSAASASTTTTTTTTTASSVVNPNPVKRINGWDDVFDIEWRKRTHNEYRQFITSDKLQQIQKWLFGKLLLSDRKFFFFLLAASGVLTLVNYYETECIDAVLRVAKRIYKGGGDTDDADNSEADDTHSNEGYTSDGENGVTAKGEEQEHADSTPSLSPRGA